MPFVPGQAVRLQSRDGRISVEVPGNAFDRPLTLVYRTAAQQRPLLRQRGELEPPAIAGYHRGFGVMHLEAIDASGRQVKQFRANLTLTVRFTPQQLQALGLSAESLRLFWFDPSRAVKRVRGGDTPGEWVPLLTKVDALAGTATLRMDHFSAFQLSDGSSPSAAYLPSLQAWQVSNFTGAASFSYPIELPAGRAGLKPALSLSYSSDATDGQGGMRRTAQASWVGKGWSLDTGAVALHKVQLSPSSTANHYTLAFGGRSYSLMRGESLVGGAADPNNPTHWAWRPTDESYIRVRVAQSGSSYGSTGNPGRGAWDYATPLPRYVWQVWDKDGTRYDFAEDVWWMWAKCSGGGDFANSESNRWLLSSVTDVHGNTITYSYGRWSVFYSSCMGQSGTVDQAIWPTEITWSGGRYRVEFVSSARQNDTLFDHPEYTVGGPVRETRQLDAIRVWSNPSGSWQLVRQYNFGYDYSLRSDARNCTNAPTCSTWGPDHGYPKLTLKSIQRVASDGATALPAMTFSYSSSDGSGYEVNGGWNRLTGMSNGQGGSVSLTYANIASVSGNTTFRNRHRVTGRTLADGRGNSYPWSYSYGTPLVNTVGTSLNPGDPSNFGTPTSAVLYYNVFLDGDADFDQQVQLQQQTLEEFRGHSWSEESDPSGARTHRSFVQGNAGCVPTGKGSHAAITGDSCFQQLLAQEFQKGREWRVEQRTGGNILLAETATSFRSGPVDYSFAPLTGLWRAFTYTSATDETAWEGGGTPVTKRTEYVYAMSCDWNSPLDAYGRLSCVREYERGTLVRRTVHAYSTFIDSGRYIVDRNIATSTYNSADQYIAHSMRFYDGNNTSLGTIGGNGRLTREIAVWNLQNRTLAQITNQQLDGRDMTYGYDSWGNRATVTTYAGGGWLRWNGSAWQASGPGNGSAARTTTTAYDTRYRALPTSVTNALGHVESAGYDLRMGTLTSVTDANNQTTTATYDGFGRLSTLVKPGDASWAPTVNAYYYDWDQPVRYLVGLREQAGQGFNRPVSRFYDGLGRLIQLKQESQDGAQNIITDYRYDGLGRLTQQSQPRYRSETVNDSFWFYVPTPGSGVNWTTTSYDALGRVSTLTDPAGAVTSTRYFIEGSLRVTDVTDARRHRLQQYADSFGRLRRSRELSGNCDSGGMWGYSCAGAFTTPYAEFAVTQYNYSPMDLLTEVIDARGNSSSMSYDSLGQKTGHTDRNMGSWSYGYDANGNLAIQFDGKGQATGFGYDALDRLTVRNGNGWADYNAYDQPYGSGIGRRTTASTTVNGTTLTHQQWVYDARGRVTQVNHDQASLSTRTFLYSYDSADRQTSVTYPSGEVVSYTYDAAWRQNSVCGSVCYVTSATYTALDGPDVWNLGNGLRQDWNYNALGRLSQLRLGYPSAPTGAFDRAYNYDGVGNLTALTNWHTGQSTIYSYDHRNRLSGMSGGGQAAESYSYDQLGNLLQRSSSQGTTTYGYGANGTANNNTAGPHQLRLVNGAAAYSYDANGNLLSGGGRTLVWDAQNRPTSISGAGIIDESYLYNHDGERVRVTSSQETRRYVAGLWEDTTAGATRSYYTLNGQTVATREASGSSNVVTYLHGDHLGSVSLATNASGTTISQQEFDAWGKIRSGSIGQTRRNYTGQILDGTGLLFYNARYYDPAIGRFISADTIVPGSSPLTVWPSSPTAQKAWGASGNGPSDPQQLNRYSYALNNPVKYTDPTGHIAFIPLIVIGAKLVAKTAVGVAVRQAVATGARAVVRGVSSTVAPGLQGAAVEVGVATLDPKKRNPAAIGEALVKGYAGGAAGLGAGNVARRFGRNAEIIGQAIGETAGGAAAQVRMGTFEPVGTAADAAGNAFGAGVNIGTPYGLEANGLGPLQRGMEAIGDLGGAVMGAVFDELANSPKTPLTQAEAP